MSRPLLEMADIVRYAGQGFIERSRRWINGQHEKVLTAIARCRTAALGGHRDRCTNCGHTTAISYNSCRNRHCPRCQGNARRRWLQARERELLPTRYVHAVFTLPRELAPLALQNKRLIYTLLFHASAETLLEVARDPRHLGAKIGFFSVLHTWNQRLEHHPHVHCVAAAGGLAPDQTHWIASRRSFFLPIKVLSRVFRGKFLAGLKTAFLENRLAFYGHLAPLAEPPRFAAWLRCLFRHDWVVYAKPPFGGPEHTLRYLSGYTHRVAAPPDSARRRVPPPLPPPPAATRLHAHPQLRLPRQPATRLVATTLLPTARKINDPRCAYRTPHPRSAPFLHILELPRLRRHHARRRTTLGGAAAAALATACPRMCRMNLQRPPRSLPCSRSDTAALSHRGQRILRTTATTLCGDLTTPRFRLLRGRDPLTSPTAAPTPSIHISPVG
jgi:hypothetical protein